MQPFPIGQGEFDSKTGQLRHGDVSHALKPLHAKLLTHFVTQPGMVFSVEALKTQVWQQQYLTDSAVKKAISELRKILSPLLQDAEGGIETLPGQGYCYRPAEARKSLGLATLLRWPTVIVATLGMLIAVILWWQRPQTITLTLVEQTDPQSQQGLQIQSINEVLRTSLLGSLTPYFDVRQLYSTPVSADLILRYQVSGKGQLTMHLEDESGARLWEKQALIDEDIHDFVLQVLAELSSILDVPLALPLNAEMHQSEAYALYLKGKIIYYQGGATDKVKTYFTRSLQLQADNNPSQGALLDILGLEVRSLPFEKRTPSKMMALNNQVKAVEQHLDGNVDNHVALAKYFLVNQGDAKAALKVLDDAPISLTHAYDLHVLALTYALNGEKQQSRFLMQLAEQRFPQRNVVLWYKAMVHLINGELSEARLQVRWAQDVAPDWYPLNYIAAHLFNGEVQSVLEYLADSPLQILKMDWRKDQKLNEEVKRYFNELSLPQWRPFEAELAYLLAGYFGLQHEMEKTGQYILAQYPEKKMMLSMIDSWLALYGAASSSG
ncbi:winged helix-turn-helix domain-containing protein [Aliiglaciecola sp. CAU 1673]|uniref:winged helix-turn-helix domain-containing protein n=1 Tax=Aliiglaciecola sp. CAU 1673 TaxID=3032595 RepID=UPI0023DB9A06|nr:winged helix-turn-helix domain-containing protein [Aliiglaciecola sp. CAU 1673]MDF2179369.1 winged helix-turn-helix domain-containing protein [Aliiglaciecola sp. CAU 1673]